MNATTGNSYVLTAEDDGWYFRATSRATDSAEPANTLNNHSNVLGPVTTPTTIGDVSVTVNDIDYNTIVGTTLTVLMNDQPCRWWSRLMVMPIAYKWEARNEYRVLVT